MAKTYTPSSEVNIPSLQQKQTTSVDPMRSGAGTPWEDRGAGGTIPSFFKTCVMSLSQPKQLLISIRRPDTTGDAVPFAVGCGVLWGISSAIHNALLYYLRYSHDTKIDLDPNSYLLYSGVQFVIACVLPLVFLKFYTTMFAKLANAGDMKHRVPNHVLFNIFAYCLGPSLLAPIPAVGPLLAVLWIVVLLMVAAKVRLSISMAGAVVNTMMVFIGFAVIGFLVFYLVGKFGPSSMTEKPVQTITNGPR